MKYTAVIFTLAAAAMATADVEGRNWPTGSTCSATGKKQVCCKNRNGALGLLDNLNCLVQVDGAACSNTAWCCKTNNQVGATLVNINALNCVQIL